jgi:hypothetical protein
MQFSILMKNEGNGNLAVRQTRKMPGIKTTTNNKKAQIELTLLVMFVFVSCFPVGFNKCLETSQY